MPSKSPRVRADALLTARGLAESRARAQALIMAGVVRSAEQVVAKPGDLLCADAPLRVLGPDHPWVSRGGVKLAAAMAHFHLDPGGRVALDVGASTGGFTDVLLRHGAARVYAVDVGRGQLHRKLCVDPRVVALEGVNARTLDATQVPEPVMAVTCDASFIGLEKVLPAALALAAPGAWLCALIKPQFQVGRAAVARGGVVRDPAARAAACMAVRAWLDSRPGWRVEGVIPSPITGPAGNIEFLICARLGDGPLAPRFHEEE